METVEELRKQYDEIAMTGDWDLIEDFALELIERVVRLATIVQAVHDELEDPGSSIIGLVDRLKVVKDTLGLRRKP